MIARIPSKWRPTLGFIVFAVLATVIALPLVGLFFFRIYDNQLIHQTQAELIAQSSVLSVLYVREVEARRAAGIALGAEIAPEFTRRQTEPRTRTYSRPTPSEPFADTTSTL